jgi:CRISPR-associated protein Cmr6
MNIPAVPKYVREAAAGGFGHCPPGHRFNLYLPIWQVDNWLIERNGKAEALCQCLTIGNETSALLKALRHRQQAFAAALPEDQRQIIDAVSTSPFATGLGLEHPVDNGFAFLSPYGLPYLAGSGVKGVLRRAAELLLDGGETLLSQPLIDALFGRDSDDEPLRGALSCWDVFPLPAGDGLVVEIMTPHFADYFQKKGTPNDAGKPNPIPFLAIPARSEFRFVITCEVTRLPAGYADWKTALDKIVAHAFDWLGFGAKTAVGYGALSEDPAAVEIRRLQEAARRQRATELAEAARRSELSPEALALESARDSMTEFRGAFEAEKAKGRYKAGSPIDEKRLQLFRLALDWQVTPARHEAAALLREVIKWTDWPGNKVRKQEFRDWLTALEK